jgi:anti-sigma28 factor (negative regulator of flagellin synthesis)
MKIQNDALNVPLPVSSETGKVSRKDGAAGTQADGNNSARVDNATISAIAQHLHADPARLDRLREAVLNGTYTVPAHEVSARIIDEHLNKTG